MTTSVLFDTNVILDIALMRLPYFKDAKALFELMDTERIKGFISATTVTDIYYIAQKEKGHKSALLFITHLTEILEIIGVDKEIILSSLEMKHVDFEDSIQTTVAMRNGLDCITTRNIKDFKDVGIKVLSPTELLDECQRDS